MAIKTRDLRKCLITKFGFEPVGGTKHEAVALIVDGRKVATTRFSFSSPEIRDNLLSRIADQVRVDLQTLKRMCECTVSAEEYRVRLRQSGYMD
jgi:hypothetical protein